MSEFSEVMRQAKRMCNGLNDCDECQLRDVFDVVGCPFAYDSVDMRNVEKPVMDWAAAHPEPRYPTWKEWQDANFPNNDALMRPCIFESEEYFNCKQENGCETCMNKPIPADIAEKLGIKPIGGSDDERYVRISGVCVLRHVRRE